MNTATPTLDTIFRNVRKAHRDAGRWEAQIRIGETLVSVDGNGVYDVGTAARSHARGARRDVAPALQALLGSASR